MKAEICKARAGQGEQGHRLGTGLRQPCCVKQSSAGNLEAEWLLVRTGIQMARREGFSFQAAIVTLPLQGTEPCSLWALPAHAEHSRQHIPVGTALWFGTSRAVTLQHMCLPGHQLQVIPGTSTAES